MSETRANISLTISGKQQPVCKLIGFRGILPKSYTLSVHELTLFQLDNDTIFFVFYLYVLFQRQNVMVCPQNVPWDFCYALRLR